MGKRGGCKGTTYAVCDAQPPLLLTFVYGGPVFVLSSRYCLVAAAAAAAAEVKEEERDTAMVSVSSGCWTSKNVLGCHPRGAWNDRTALLDETATPLRNHLGSVYATASCASKTYDVMWRACACTPLRRQCGRRWDRPRVPHGGRGPTLHHSACSPHRRRPPERSMTSHVSS